MRQQVGPIEQKGSCQDLVLYQKKFMKKISNSYSVILSTVKEINSNQKAIEWEITKNNVRNS